MVINHILVELLLAQHKLKPFKSYGTNLMQQQSNKKHTKEQDLILLYIVMACIITIFHEAIGNKNIKKQQQQQHNVKLMSWKFPVGSVVKNLVILTRVIIWQQKGNVTTNLLGLREQ